MIFGHEQSYWITRKRKWEAKIQRLRSSVTSAKSNILFDLLNESPTATSESKIKDGHSSLSPDRRPSADGSVMSEILQDKLRRVSLPRFFRIK